MSSKTKEELNKRNANLRANKHKKKTQKNDLSYENMSFIVELEYEFVRCIT